MPPPGDPPPGGVQVWVLVVRDPQPPTHARRLADLPDKLLVGLGVLALLALLSPLAAVIAALASR